MTSATIDFFIPIRYEGKKNCLQSIHQGIEDYFFLFGKSVYVIPSVTIGDTALVELRASEVKRGKMGRLLLNIAKIVSYATVLIPVVMMVFKAHLRGLQRFHMIPPQSASPHEVITMAALERPAEIGESARIERLAEEFLRPLEIHVERKEAPHVAPIRRIEAPLVVHHSVVEHSVVDHSVRGLMRQFTAAWSELDGAFTLEFRCKEFIEELSRHALEFSKKEINEKEHFGYIEKVDLDPKQRPQIYMRADLHGDLKSLIENLRTLQSEGLLDEEYKCRPGVHLVFLGDYCDRGSYGTQILQVLMRLRQENRGQVHLIRGNHEYLDMNKMYSGSDTALVEVLRNEIGVQMLANFYQTMPLTTYFSVGGAEVREYIQCTHALFEPTVDLAPLLDREMPYAYMAVSKQRILSERVSRLAPSDPGLGAALRKVKMLARQSILMGRLLTAYNWGDVSERFSSYRSLGDREYSLNAQDIRYCLDVSCDRHRVEMIFRGHQHQFQHLMYKDRVLVTTLPVGMDSPPYRDWIRQPDRAYILTPAPRVADWRKRAILRSSGRALTELVTEAHPLGSLEI